MLIGTRAAFATRSLKGNSKLAAIALSWFVDAILLAPNSSKMRRNVEWET